MQKSTLQRFYKKKKMTRSEVVVAIKLLLWTFLLKSSLALYANKASINFKTSANLNSLNSVRAVQLPVGKAIYEQYTLGQMEEGELKFYNKIRLYAFVNNSERFKFLILKVIF